MVILNVGMKSGEKYTVQIEAKKEDLNTILDGRQFLRLDWPDAFAMLNVTEIVSLTVNEVKESVSLPK